MSFNKSLVAKLGFINHYNSTIGNMVSYYGISNNVPNYVKDSEGISVYGNVNIHIFQVADLKPSIVISISKNIKRKHCREFNHEHKHIVKIEYNDQINVKQIKDTIWQEVRAFYKKVGIR